MANEFYVTFFSNNSMNKYPNNVLSCFTNYIECPIILEGAWSVGISEIYYNKFTHNYTPSDDCFENINVTVKQCNDVTMKCNNENVTGNVYRKCLDDVDNVEKLYEFFYIHTDIIKLRVVGDQMVRCLKVLTADAKQDEYIRFGNIEHYPIEASYIRSISISILDCESKKIHFNESSLPTLITLHFKQE